MTVHNGYQAAPVLRTGNHRASIYHGPIDRQLTELNIRLLTLTGSGQADLLHAAASWISAQPEATLVGINWHNALLNPRSNPNLLPPLHRLDLTISLPD